MKETDAIVFAKGATIFKEGDFQDFAYVIISGYVDIVIQTAKGAKTIATIGPNNLLGEMALFDGEARSATAVAIEEVVCHIIEQHHLNRIYGDKHSITRKLFQIQSQRLRQMNNHLRDDLR